MSSTGSRNAVLHPAALPGVEDDSDAEARTASVAKGARRPWRDVRKGCERAACSRRRSRNGGSVRGTGSRLVCRNETPAGSKGRSRRRVGQGCRGRSQEREPDDSGDTRTGMRAQDKDRPKQKESNRGAEDAESRNERQEDVIRTSCATVSSRRSHWEE